MQDKLNVVIAHGEDVDGIYGAALMLRCLKGETMVYLVSHREQDKFFAEFSLDVEAYLNANIFVLDLPLKENMFENSLRPSVVELFMSHGKTLTFIDHHECHIADKFVMAGCMVLLGGKVKKCTSRLIFENFYNGCDIAAKTLAEIAQLNDYNDSSASKIMTNEGVELQRLITYYNCRKGKPELLNLVNIFAKEENWQAAVSVLIGTCSGPYNLAIKEVAKNNKIIKLKNFEVLLALVDPILPEKEIMRLLRTNFGPVVDACIGIFPDPINNISVYAGSRSVDFPVEELCCRMGGGGRDGDGGFSIPTTFNWSSLHHAETSIRTVYLECFHPL